MKHEEYEVDPDAPWDARRIKALLWLPGAPARLIQEPPWLGWVAERGGVEAVRAQLLRFQLRADLHDLLQAILDEPYGSTLSYARRLKIGRTAYFTRLQQLVEVLLPQLNSWRVEHPAERRAPPVVAQATSSSSLPWPLTPLIAREREVEAICARMRGGVARLLTITGPGGVGKTRVAIEAARRLQDHFSDGILYLALAPLTDSGLVPLRIAQALGLKERDDQQLVDRLAAYLGERELLLVLDNMEHLVEAGPLLVALLQAAPRLCVLVTSRVVLELYGEHEFLLPLLGLPNLQEQHSPDELAGYPAVRLFLERAAAIRPRFALDEHNAQAIARLCVRLDGLPLALELAAAQVRMLSPQAILAQLDRRLDLLRSGVRDSPARQQTLRNTMDWSYDLLAPHEQRLFRRLAIFAGSWDLPAAAAICLGDEEQDAQALLELAALAGKSLVRPLSEEERFTMLETMREYGLEQLTASGERQELERTHAAYYLALLELAEQGLSGREQQRWVQRLEWEHDNVRAALAALLRQGAPEQALRLASATWKFWQVRGYHAEGRRWLDRASALAETRMAGAIELAERRALASERARARYATGWLANDQGDFAAATQFFEQSEALAREIDDQEALSMALQGVGHMAMFAGDFEQARRCFEKSLALCRARGDAEEVAWSINHIGHAARCQGDLERATETHAESLRLFTQLGHAWGRANALNHLAETLLEQGRIGAAEELLRPWLEQRRADGNDKDVMFVQGSCLLGECELGLGRLGDARATLERCLALAREMGYKSYVSRTLVPLARLELREGNLGASKRLYGESARLQRGLHEPWTSALILEGVAALALAAGALHVAAQLSGSANHARSASGIPLAPLYRDDVAHTVAQLRETLGAGCFEQAWAEGAARELQPAIDAALAYLEGR